METEKVIQDARDILKYGRLGRALYHKIEELKVMLSQQVGRPLHDMAAQEKGKRTTMEGIEYELNLFGKNMWIPTIPENPGCNAYEFIPQDIVDFIVNCKSEIGIIKMLKGVELPGLKGRLFDLIFEKSAPGSFKGIIKEHKVDHSGFLYPDTRTEKGLFQGVEDTGKEETMKLLFYYLMNDEEYFNQVSSEFYYKWKPLIDNKLMPRAIEE